MCLLKERHYAAYYYLVDTELYCLLTIALLVHMAVFKLHCKQRSGSVAIYRPALHTL